MSLILEGIDLPTDRKPYAIEVTYRFEGADGLFSEEIFLSPNQAIQIPKGHGAIKDTGEIIKLFRRVTSINKSIMIDAIQQTDTILEQEE